MRFITPRLHRALDLVTIAAFAVAPILLGLSGVAAFLAYGLAVVHLALTLATHFPGGAARPVPLALHGVIEALVAPGLIAVALLSGWTGAARPFYLSAGVVIGLVGLLSRYNVDEPGGTP